LATAKATPAARWSALSAVMMPDYTGQDISAEYDAAD
jgi:hypothetical protein